MTTHLNKLAIGLGVYQGTDTRGRKDCLALSAPMAVHKAAPLEQIA